MARYACAIESTMSTTIAVGVVYAPASSMRRFKVWDLMFGCYDTPGDTSMRLQAVRSTTAPTTPVAVTPNPLDSADAAAVTLASSKPAANGTNSGVILEWVQNQRSTVRWFAAPGEELVVPATASAGIHFLTPTAPTLLGNLTVVFDE